MGFFDDLFSGDFGAVASDIGGFLSNPLNDLALVGSALVPFAAPELLGGAAAAGAGGALLGGEAALDTGLASSALAGAETGAVTGAGTDLSALLSGAAGAAGDAAIPANATFTSGTGLNLPGFTSPTTPTLPGGSPFASLDATGAGFGPGTAPIAEAATPTAGTATGSGASLVDQLTGAAGGGGAGPSGSGSIVDQLLTGAGNQITKNPIGVGAGALGLGASLLKGNKPGPAEQQMQWQGAVLGQQGNQLQGFTLSGTLPPAVQAQLDQQIQAAKARIIQNHAAQGRSTDPSQNSALAQELNNVDSQALAMKGQLEQQLFAQGAQDLQLSNELITQVANFDRQDQQAVTQALMNFAKAMSPSAGGVQLKLA